MGKCWEHIGKKEEKQKNNFPHPTPRQPTPKRKKQGPSWVHAEPSQWTHETFISKTVCYQFLGWANARGRILGTYYNLKL